jgi:hypothetical protein
MSEVAMATEPVVVAMVPMITHAVVQIEPPPQRSVDSGKHNKGKRAVHLTLLEHENIQMLLHAGGTTLQRKGATSPGDPGCNPASSA